MKKKLYILLLAICQMTALTTWAQIIPAYVFRPVVSTYTPIVSGTQVGCTTEDSYGAVSLPFDFQFGETTYPQGDEFYVSSNGYITFETPDETMEPKFSSNYSFISALGHDLKLGEEGVATYEVSGTEPNRVLTVQWSAFECYSGGNVYHFQVKLHETTNAIEICYGTMSVITQKHVIVGLYDYRNDEKLMISGSGNWADFTATPTPSSRYVSVATVSYPDSGLVYSFTPPLISCMRPTVPQVSNITSSSADLSWTEKGTATSWNIEYGPKGYTHGEGTVVAAATIPFTVTGLTPHKEYDFYVQSNCGEGNVSGWRGPVRGTVCAPVSVPYSEDFNSYNYAISSDDGLPESYPDCDFPLCWTFLNSNADPRYSPNAYITSDMDFVTRGNSLMLRANSAVPIYAILPAFDVDINTLRMTFKYLNYEAPDADGNLEVGYMTNPADASTFVSLQSCQDTAKIVEIEQSFGSVPASGSGNSYIALKFQSSLSFLIRSIEDVYVESIQGCVRPGALKASNVTATSVDLSWTERGTASAWSVEYGPRGYVPGTGTAVAAATNPFTVTGLTPATEYDFYLRSDCGNGAVSGWYGPVSVTPASYNMPVSGTDTITTCSAIVYDDGGINGKYSTDCDATVVIKPATEGAYINVVGIGQYETYGKKNFLTIYDGTDTLGEKLFTTKETYDGSIPHCYSSSGSITLYFKSKNTTRSGFALSVSCSDCPGISRLTASHETNTTIDLTWMDRVPAGSWTVTYYPEGDPSAVVTRTVTTQNCTLTGLEPSTAYRATVKKRCGDEERESTVSFTTTCTPMSMPYFEDFNRYIDVSLYGEYPENYPECDLPTCWKFLNCTDYRNGYPKAFLTGKHEYVTTGNSLCLEASDKTPLYAVLPPFDVDITKLQMTFKYRNGDMSRYDGILEVGYMTNPKDISTFVSLYTCPRTDVFVEVDQTFGDVPALGAGNSYIAFKYSGVIRGYLLNIEDVKIDLAPTCLSPGGLQANVSNTSVKLSWTERGTATSWNVEYGPEGFTHGEGTVAAVTSNSFTATGLTPATKYDFYVQSNCGDGVVSEWRGPVSAAPGVFNMPLSGEAIFTLCDGIVYDDGGQNGDYSYGIEATAVIYPAEDGAFVRVQGVDNYVINDYDDFLEIYDGVGTNGTKLFSTEGTYTAQIPACQSTTGPLTLYFTSGFMTSYSGFALQVSCTDCPTPGVLTLSNLKSTSVDVAWPSEISDVSWVVSCYRQGDSTALMTRTVTTRNYTLTGLEPNTAYVVSVKTSCGEEERESTASFTTTCTPTAIPYAEDFNSYNTAVALGEGAPADYPTCDLPSCWRFLNRVETGDGFPKAFLTKHSDYVTTGNSLFFQSSEDAPLYAVLPPFDVDIKTLQISFKYRNENISNSNGILEVGYMTNPDDPATFVSLYTCPRTLSMEEVEQSFSSVPALGVSNSYIAFKYSGRQDNYYLSIEDVNVESNSCLKPEGLTVSVVTANSVEVGWTERGTATSWNIEYGPKGYTHGEGTVVAVTTNPFVVTGLTPATEYDFYVLSNCGNGDVSGWRGPVSALPGIYNMPVSGNDTITWCGGFIYDDGGANGDYSNSCDATVVVKPATEGSYVKVQGIGDYNIENGYDTLTIYDGVGTSGTILFSTKDTETNTGRIPLCQSFYGPVTIRFRSDESYFYSGFALQVSCTECPLPGKITYSNLTTNSVDLSWPSEASNASWNVSYYPHDDTAAILTKTVTTQNCSLTGLVPNTKYYIEVKSACDSEFPAAKIAITTNCTPVAVPYSENFNSYQGVVSSGKYAPASYPDCDLPSCWRFLNRAETSDDFPEAFITTHSDYANTGNSLILQSSGDAPLYAVLPEFVADINTLQLSFKYRNEGTGNNDGTLSVGYMTDPEDVNTFVMLDSFPKTTALTEVEQSFGSVPALGAGNSYIAFKYTGRREGYALSIEDVFVESLSACKSPVNLTVSGVSDHSVELNWTERATSTLWNIEYGPKGHTQGEGGTVVPANANPFTVTGLTPATEYDFYVQSDCGDGNVSRWYGPVSVTTYCSPMTLPYSEDFNSYSNSVSDHVVEPAAYPDCDLPACWRFPNRSENSSYNPKAFLTSKSDYVTTGNSLFLISSDEAPLYALLPTFDVDINALQLTFKYRNESTSEASAVLEVGYLTDASDPSTFVSLYSCPKTKTITAVEQSFRNVPALGAGNGCIAFKYSSVGTNFYTSIEDVNVSAFLAYHDDKDTVCVSSSSVTVDKTFTPAIAPSGTLSYAWAVQSNGGVSGAVDNSTPTDHFEAVLSNNGTTKATVVYKVTPYVTITENETSDTYAGAPFEYSVTVLPKPTVALTVDDTVLTAGQVATLTATPTPADGTYTYTWSGDLEDGPADNVKKTRDMSRDGQNMPMYYNVKVADEKGCESEETSIMIVTIDPGRISQSEWTCGADTTLRLYVSGLFAGGTCQWQKQDATGSWENLAGATYGDYQAAATGTYRLSYSYGGVTVYTGPVSVTHPREQNIGTIEPLVGAATSVCEGDDVTVKLKNNGTGSNCPSTADVNWEMKVGSGDWSDQNTSADSLVKQLTSVVKQHEFRTYKSAYTNCKVYSSNTFVLTVDQVPTVTLTADKETVCGGDFATLTATPTPAADTYTYTWSGDLEDGPADNVKITKTDGSLGENTYRVTAISSHGCVSDEEIVKIIKLSAAATFANIADTFCTPKQSLNRAFTPETVAYGTLKYTWTVKSNTGITGANANSTPALFFFGSNLTNSSVASATVVYEVTPYATQTIGNRDYTCTGTPFEYSVTLKPSITNDGALTYDNADVVTTLHYGVNDTLLHITSPTISTAITEWQNSLTVTNNVSAANEGALLGRLTPGTHTITWTVTDPCGNAVRFDRNYIVQYPLCGEGYIVSDVDGNTYETVRIGSSCWTKSNLKTTKYSDGTAVPFATGYASLDYPDVDDNIDGFGRLYTWYSAVNVPEGDDSAVPATITDPMSGRVYVQGICPEGWALPSTQDLQAMTDLADNVSVLKSADQQKWLPGATGTDALGFTAVAGGYYDAVTARYLNLLGEAYFWTYDTHTATEASCLTVPYHCDQALYQDKVKGMGYSVRCVKRTND